jgi:CRISPR-associated protein Csy1
MNEELTRSPRSELFRSSITAFINARRDAKLKSKEEDTDTSQKYEYTTWLADAARRVPQIQAVTHVLKATHPDARGTSLHVPPDSLPQHTEVGTHALGATFDDDIVGNAAALDVFKFLKIEVEGRRLLEWMQQGDTDLSLALNADQETAQAWISAFCGLVRSSPQTSSHEMAKQIYWLVGTNPADNAQYHLLQPLFSSSLAHAVHNEISEARFGEANTQARQAFRAKQAHPAGYRNYSGLAVRKLGGTKPQNISQLNSERGGANYLLAALPPPWRTDDRIKILNTGSAIERFGHTPVAKALVKRLAEFLLGNPPATEPTRKTRERLEQALADELAAFGAQITAQMPAGWTQDPACTLHESEKLWLDGGRTELPLREGHEQEDAAFNAAYTWGDWPDGVAGRFANWVNERLRAAGLIAVGDVEARHWARQAIIDTAWPIPQQRRAGGAA